MATQAEQLQILQQQQQETISLLSGLSTDVGQIVAKQADLVQQIALLNSQVGQDLSPMVNDGQSIVLALTGIKDAVEAALGTAQATAPVTGVSPPPDTGTPVDTGTPTA